MNTRKPSVTVTDIKYYICIDDYMDNDIKGRIFHYFMEHKLFFRSSVEMLLMIEHEMNHMRYPQETTEHRYFKGLKPKKTKHKEWHKSMKESEIMMQKGEKSTFIVEIKYRENATWQGTLNWVEGNQTLNFRSALELLRLMDSINSIMGNKIK